MNAIKSLITSLALVLVVTAPTLVHADIQIQKRAVQGPLDAEDQYLLEVQLGKLSQQEFDILHARFQTPPSKYDTNRNYRITDFLPGFMQILNGKRYVDHSIKVPSKISKLFKTHGITLEPEMRSDANCHSLTWQWINHAQGNGLEDGLFTLADGDRLFNDLPEKDVVTVDKIQAGDVLFIRGSSFEQSDEILHTAVYLGDGLVFEKGNPGTDYPYRVAYLEDVMNKYKRLVQDAKFMAFHPSKDQTPVNTLFKEVTLCEVDNMISHGIDPNKFPAKMVCDYGLSEEYDQQNDRALFILVRLPTTKTIEADFLKPVGKSGN